MGSELLFDVWQPNALVLPFLAFLVVVTVLATGDLAMAPWVVGIGSLVVQTHMSHIVLVGVLLLVVGTALGVWAWRRRDEPRRRGDARSLWAGGGGRAGVGPDRCIEQFTSPGEGNLSRIVEAATVQRGARRSAGAGPPASWPRSRRAGRGSPATAYADAVPPTTPDTPILGIVGVAIGAWSRWCWWRAAVVAVTVWAVRSGRRSLATLAGMAGVALATAYVALATSPVNHIAGSRCTRCAGCGPSPPW